MKIIKKQPEELEAVQFIEKDEEGQPTFSEQDVDWLDEAQANGTLTQHPIWPERLQLIENPEILSPRTHIVDPGDWIMFKADGTLRVIKPDEFEENYEAS